MNDNIAALREQLQKLKALHAEGSLGDEAYEKARAPLERQLLDSVLAAPPPVPAAARPSGKLTALLSLSVLLLAGAGYWWTGSPGAPTAATPGATRSAAATADGVVAEPTPAETEQQFAAAVAQLAEKLKTQPDNAEGWAMLARSYSRLGRFPEAVPAFEKAVALNPKDARLLADFADTVAMQNDRSLEGRPTELLNLALKLEPENPKVLALAGTAAFNRKDYKGAVALWEKLQQVTPADAAFLPQLQSSIAEARELGGMAKAAVVPPAAPGTPPMAAAQPPAATTAPASAAAGPPAAVTGTVRLAPAVAQMAQPNDTVFVFARAQAGAGMPLAILRKQVKDLPLEFKLDDSSAMAPAMKLSLFPQVVISARVSKSGQAAPSPGDLRGQSAPVANTAAGVVVEINEVVKN
jgi:cytochrome c-type biogenesis protein CcmH